MALRAFPSALIAIIVAAGSAGAQPPPSQLPARDAPSAARKPGTAIVRGRVLDGQTRRPLRRVRISLTTPDLPRDGISTSTDSDGVYELTELPSGRFTLTARRGGYLPLRYGQRRPLEQGKPLDLADAQVVENVDFALQPMGILSGRVTDELGEPIAGVWVSAQRYIYQDNRRRLLPDGPIATTDEDGEYRIVNVVPGTYLVNARTLEKWSVRMGEREETMGYAPTFFPGVTDPGVATRVAIAIGQSVVNVNFSLVPGRAATISGAAKDSHGRPLQNVQLVHELMGTGGGIVGMAGSASVSADGRFEIRGVPPGEYKLQATGPQESVWLPIALNGVDKRVTLTTSAGGSVSGRVVIDGDAPAGLRKNQMSVSAVSLATRSGMSMTGGAVLRQSINDDWTFSVTGVVGAARLRVTLPEGWAVKAIVQGDRDITDAPLEFTSGEELAGIQIVVTDRVATVTGQIVDSNGAASDGTVLLFPVDSMKWYEGSRFTRAARPDQKGQYRIPGVMPGEYWLVAMDFVEEGIWNDPGYLDSIRRHAQKVSLVDPAPQSFSLKLVTP